MFWQIILLNGVATFTEYNRLADFATQSIVSTTSFKPKEVFRLVDTYVNRIALSMGHTVVLVCLDFAVLVASDGICQGGTRPRTPGATRRWHQIIPIMPTTWSVSRHQSRTWNSGVRGRVTHY
jgi:hypothetical protein